MLAYALGVTPEKITLIVKALCVSVYHSMLGAPALVAEYAVFAFALYCCL